MFRGPVEFSHNAENDTMMIANIATRTKYEVSVDTFIDDFLIGQEKMELKEGENKRFLLEKFIKSTGALPNPEDPETAKELIQYLDTIVGLDMPKGKPAFDVEFSVKFNTEKDGVELVIKGIDEDVIRCLHACLQSDIKFENLIMRATAERMNMIIEADKMRAQQKEKSKKK